MYRATACSFLRYSTTSVASLDLDTDNHGNQSRLLSIICCMALRCGRYPEREREGRKCGHDEKPGIEFPKPPGRRHG